MVVIIFLACCIASSGGEGVSDRLFERRTIETTLGHWEKMEFIKKAYESNKTIQDIADKLGMSMMAVKKYIDEIEKREAILNRDGQNTN